MLYHAKSITVARHLSSCLKKNNFEIEMLSNVFNAKNKIKTERFILYKCDRLAFILQSDIKRYIVFKMAEEESVLILGLIAEL